MFDGMEGRRGGLTTGRRRLPLSASQPAVRTRTLEAVPQLGDIMLGPLLIVHGESGNFNEGVKACKKCKLAYFTRALKPSEHS